MMNEMNVQIDELIAKKLCGENTPEDDAVLQEWLKAAPDNRQIYDKHAKQWMEVEALIKGVEFDTAAAWEKVAAKTVDVKAQPARRIISLKSISWAAAAILVVGVLLYRVAVPGYSEEVFAENGNMEVVLPDDTHVTLHKGSKLAYNKTFIGKERKVSLEGEAFFKVHRDEQHPFVIDAQAARVQVLGTAFDLKCNEHAATVAVVEGRVKFSAGDDKNTFVVLTKGQQAQLTNDKLVSSAIEDENFLYWKTGIISYHERELQAVVAQLSEIFEKDISLAGTMPVDQAHQLITVSFDGQGLEPILSEICLVARCRWEKGPGDKYNISPR
ncbi:MAG: FecR domain-containing protein [Chitinophagaceae bacterium]|nr:FecR domain-containing protein [Chitinophagaceae bacterium]